MICCNVASKELLTNILTIDFNMFCALMEDWIRRDVKGILVITKELQVGRKRRKKVLEPSELKIGNSHGMILYFKR